MRGEKTDLMIACIEGNASKMHDILVRNKTDVNARDINRKTALDYLAENPEYKYDLYAILFFRSYGAKHSQELDNIELGKIMRMMENSFNLNSNL
jgi:hypothetical protein